MTHPYTIPNILTALRIVLIPAIVVFFYLPYSWSDMACGLLFALAGITDSIDGYLARRLGQVSPLGAFLESVDTSFEHWRVERVSYRAAYGEERIEALLYLPETATPPYSVVVYVPHAAVHLSRRPFELSDGELSHFLFFLRGGRAVLYPMCHGTYARHVDGFFEEETFEESLRRTVLDIRRSVDYLETRSDVDAGAIAYCGWGFGANNGPLTLAVESRFSAAVLISGGFPRQAPRPAVDAEIFAPRVRQPTLMVGGRHDPYCDLES